MRSIAPRYLAALAALTVVFACGDVPTLDNGIAYISPVQLPAPAVAAGDTLRDSLGRAVPLSIIAYDRGNVALSGITPTFVVSSFPIGATIDAAGRVIALDSVRTVQIVGRIGSSLQTAAVTLEVVAQPDSMAVTSTVDSLAQSVLSRSLDVNVTGARGGKRVTVKGIIVRYRITNLYPARAFDSSLVALSNGRTVATDTTAEGGTAGVSVILTNKAGIDSVAVEARANNLRGVALKGSPIRFVLPIKRGT